MLQKNVTEIIAVVLLHYLQTFLRNGLKKVSELMRERMNFPAEWLHLFAENC